MKSKHSTKHGARTVQGAIRDHQPTTANDAHLAPEEADKVGRVRDALERGDYAMDRAVDVTVDRVIADLYGE